MKHCALGMHTHVVPADPRNKTEGALKKLI